MTPKPVEDRVKEFAIYINTEVNTIKQEILAARPEGGIPDEIESRRLRFLEDRLDSYESLTGEFYRVFPEYARGRNKVKK